MILIFACFVEVFLVSLFGGRVLVIQFTEVGSKIILFSSYTSLMQCRWRITFAIITYKIIPGWGLDKLTDLSMLQSVCIYECFLVILRPWNVPCNYLLLSSFAECFNELFNGSFLKYIYSIMPAMSQELMIFLFQF